jgi:class 3 adenylate cyclase
MVVGDIFRDVDNHKLVIKEIILLAFDFLDEIKNVKTPDNKKLSLRIGIHIGSIIAGILGSEIPRLCIIANTVNIASRLQTTSEENSIQISKELFEIMKNIKFDKKFEYKFREKIFLKNIRFLNTYIINLEQ